jgi:hypothetical protein
MYSRNMPRTASLSHPHVQFLPKSTSKWPEEHEIGRLNATSMGQIPIKCH